MPQVACFDTAFHATLPPAARAYALPAAWTDRYGLRRYGFHGLSHAYAARRCAQLLETDPQQLRVVTCHLGAGSSLAAVSGGLSVDTTMGFTPLEGLVMATRPGSVDPGLLLWLLQHGGLTLDQVSDGLEHAAGLAGLAQLPDGSGDLREVRAAADAGERARPAGRRRARPPAAPRDRRHGRGHGRPGRPGLHRRHRRAPAAGPGRGRSRAGLPGRGHRSRPQPGRRR